MGGEIGNTRLGRW